MPIFSNKKRQARDLSKLMLLALGVVFGDIGTSPLYAIRECFHGDYSVSVTHANVLGVLSLMFWTLLLVVMIKYLSFIMRADNDGEGGVLALAALLKTRDMSTRNLHWFLMGIGLFAACLLYGDGMITPAISVLSAVEGLHVITPFFDPYIVPMTILILSGLFVLQKHGTARVGRLFGPIILLWFLVLGLLGTFQILRHPQVLVALFPWYGIEFLLHNHLPGFFVLGAVFLVATGAEALYADMGHFGKRPIRAIWVILVFPMLVLNYFGQGALLLKYPELSYHPFYGLVPHWAVIPVLILATLATIIASQAVITGAFSLTSQAIQLGYLPRLRIVHTSSSQMGQIYVAPVNWLLMLCTIGLVLGFKSSSKLAAAYGVAVTSTMLITTTLFYFVARQRWGWSRLSSGLVSIIFYMVDLPFFFANIIKIMHGAWFPLAIAGIFFFVMLTWKQGREQLAGQLKSITPKLEEFMAMLRKDPPTRVNGQAIFLTGSHRSIPAILLHNMRHNKIIHSQVALLHFRTEEIPRVPNFEKVEIENLGSGLRLVIVHIGFMEEPRIASIFSLLRDKGLDFRLEQTSFFLGRERLTVGPEPRMGHFRANLFLFLARNAADAATFFDVPQGQSIEIGVPLQLGGRKASDKKLCW